MTTELRKTGISVIGDIPFGARFCCLRAEEQLTKEREMFIPKTEQER